MGRLDDIARRRIEAWRKAQKLTQAALAEKIGRNPVWISRYLDQAYDADLDTLAAFATALGRSLNELLGSLPDDAEGELLERFRALGPKERTLALELLQTWTATLAWPSPAAPRATSPAKPAANHGKAGTRGNRPNRA